jgi:hypothetical protein
VDGLAGWLRAASGYARWAAGYATQDLLIKVGTGCRVRNHRYRVRRPAVGYAVLVTASQSGQAKPRGRLQGTRSSLQGTQQKVQGTREKVQGTRDR